MIPPRQIPSLPEIARAIAALTEANGGATWNLVEGDLAGRPFFAVSVFPDLGWVISPNASTELAVELEIFMRDNKALLISDPCVSVGTWVNDGKIHLDLSITVPSLAQALELGTQHGQLAVFDLVNAVDIAVPAAAREAA